MTSARPLSRVGAHVSKETNHSDFFDDRKRRVTRILRIVGILQHRPSHQKISLRFLADKFHCSTRTIQRDIAQCAEMDIIVVYDQVAHSYVLQGELPFKLLDMDVGEATAMALVEASSGPIDDLGLEDRVRASFGKVYDLVTREVADRMKSNRAAFINKDHAKRDYSNAPVMPLLAACWEHQTVEIDYDSRSSGRRVRRIEPYHIAFLNGFWIVIARDPERGELRNFALDRIYYCHFLRPSVPFKKPDGWSLEEYLANTVSVMRGEAADIILRFSPEAAVWAKERRWRFRSSLEDQPDGSVLLRGTVAGLEEITREVLHWGHIVKVLEPPALRDRVAGEARAILALYESTDGQSGSNVQDSGAII